MFWLPGCLLTQGRKLRQVYFPYPAGRRRILCFLAVSPESNRLPPEFDSRSNSHSPYGENSFQPRIGWWNWSVDWMLVSCDFLLFVPFLGTKLSLSPFQAFIPIGNNLGKSSQYLCQHFFGNLQKMTQHFFRTLATGSMRSCLFSSFFQLCGSMRGPLLQHTGDKGFS